jgi:hypothetical protein
VSATTSPPRYARTRFAPVSILIRPRGLFVAAVVVLIP